MGVYYTFSSYVTLRNIDANVHKYYSSKKSFCVLLKNFRISFFFRIFTFQCFALSANDCKKDVVLLVLTVPAIGL